MNLPDHVQRADDHTKRLFNWLMGDYETVKKYLDCQIKDLDREVAWRTFSPIAYKAIFKFTDGGRDELLEPAVTSNVWTEILDQWPEIYYLEMFVKKGIAYRFDIDDSPVYGLKDYHKEQLSKLLTAKSTK